MKTYHSTFFLVLTLAGAFAAHATDYSWSVNAADPDNVLTNSCHTSVSWETMDSTPGKHAVSLSPGSASSLTVTLPTDYVTATVLKPSAPDGKKLTFDMAGCLRQRDLTSDELSAGSRYPANLWYPYIADQMLFYDQMQNYYAADKGYGGWKLDNVKFSLDATETNVSRFELDRGTMNFFDPNGHNLSSLNLWFLIDGSAARTCYFNVHEGSTFKAPVLLVYDSFGKACVTFDGGRDHYIYKYNGRSPNHASERREHTLRVTGANTKVTFSDINFASVSPTNQKFRAEFVNGAAAEINSIKGIAHSTNIVFLADSADVKVSTVEDATFYMTNSTFRSRQSEGVFKNCDLYAKGVSFGIYGSAVLNGDSNLDWTDCTFFASNGISFFSSGTSTAYFKNCVVSNSNNTISFGTGSSGSTITVEDSRLCSLVRPGISYASIVFGTTASARDIVEILGDSALDASHKLMVGSHGCARVTLRGGTVSANYLSMQEDGLTKPVTNVYLQVGGTSTFAKYSTLCGVAGTVLSHCEIILSNGVFRTPSIGGGSNCSAKDAGKGGVAIVRLDGGRLVCTETSNSGLVNGINHLYIGSGSPEIFSDVTMSLPQSLENEPGETGEVLFTGTGTKTLSGTATTVSRIVVREGTVVFAAGSRAASTLVVEEGATVKFTEDPSQIGFTGLELKGGTVVLASGQTIAVAGDVTVGSSVFNTACKTVSTNVLVTATGSVSASSRAAWAETTLAGFAGAGTMFFDVVEEDELVKLRQIVWPVSVKIELAEGVSNATDDVALSTRYTVLEAAVGAGAELKMDGTVTGGAISKTGGGILSLVNLALWPLEAGFYLRAGTFEYVGDGSEALFDLPFVCSSTNSTKTGLSIKTDSPLVITNISNLGGVLVKRGKASLVIAPPSGTSVDLAPYDGSDGGQQDPPAPRDFGNVASASWTPPITNATMGFNVLEGEVVFRGDAQTRIDASHSVILGGEASGLTAPAGLVVDGCKCNLGGASGRYIEMGYMMKSGTDQMRHPYLYITNGAEVTSGTFIFGRNPSSSTLGDIVVDHSKWTLAAYRPGYNWQAKGYHYLRNESEVYASEFLPYGPFTIWLDNSVLAKNAKLGCIFLEICGNGGQIVVTNGSVVAFSQFYDGRNPVSGQCFSLDFAGGTWYTSSSWQPLRMGTYASWSISTLTDEGLVLPIDAGRTLYAAHEITGAGGIVKTGAGVLEFETAGEWERSKTTQATKTDRADPQTVKFTGPIDVREGSVKIWNTAGRTGGAYKAAAETSIDFDGAAIGAATLSGAGTFKNATLAGGTLAVPLTDAGTLDGAPTLTDVTLGGDLTYVDFGRTVAPDKEATGLVVVTFTGSVPDIANWHVRNLGRGMRATLRVDGNSVVADIRRIGLMMFVK